MRSSRACARQPVRNGAKADTNSQESALRSAAYGANALDPALLECILRAWQYWWQIYDGRDSWSRLRFMLFVDLFKLFTELCMN